jgi:pimeloyl-ACP methyl ester carboxylesterase
MMKPIARRPSKSPKRRGREAAMSEPLFDTIAIRTPRAEILAFAGGQEDSRRAPILYLHGEEGLTPDDPFLAALAKKHRVVAPLLPGYGDCPERDDLRDMLDFTLHGLDVLSACGLRDPLLVGQSMGGMIAAEMAALAPAEVRRLALICPAGLWRDDHPAADIFSMLPYEQPAYLFHDPEMGARRLAPTGDMSDRDFLADYLVRNARQLGMAGKILFPIPERGLAQRLYRIKARTALIWGDSDRVTPPIYGRSFLGGIAGAHLTIVPEAGHMVHWEKPAAVIRAIEFRH